MDTIVYLKMEERTKEEGQPRKMPAFHIRQIKGQYGMEEGRQLLLVTIPREIHRQYRNWPAELVAYLFPFLGYSASIETVTDPSVISWLEEKQLKEQWEREWIYPPYLDYYREEYAVYLMDRAVKYLNRANGQMLPDKVQSMQQMHVYVLGYEHFVPEVIKPYLQCIRTLTFIVPEKTAEAHDGSRQTHTGGYNLEEYLEVLCEEEGLAASLRTLQMPRGFRGLRLPCVKPALILDLSGEEKVLPENGGQSVSWVDMDAFEHKSYRIKASNAETAYFSMKEEWRSLDTERKNRYNTYVN